LLRALSQDDLSALNPSMREVTLPAGRVLYHSGDPIEDLYFPNTAVLSIVTRMKSGRSVQIATVGFESAVGLLPGLTDEPAPSEVVVQAGGAAISLTARALRRRAAECPQFMRLIALFALSNASRAEQSVACNALHGVSARLARWLLQTDDRIGNSMVPLVQEDLAVMLGVQRTTVSAVAAELKAASLISYTRGRIEIIDRIGLERQACECYATHWETFNRLAPEAHAETAMAVASRHPALGPS
jgi:CRP-like cAMP-binding protein